MSIESKIKQVLAEQHMQVIVLADKLEEAQARIKELEAKVRELTPDHPGAMSPTKTKNGKAAEKTAG